MGALDWGFPMTMRPKRPKLVRSLSVRFQRLAKDDRNPQGGEQETTFCRLNDMTW
jgi:ribosomal protein L32E